MLLSELKENKQVCDAVKSIVSDKVFLKKCELNFHKIFEDGKVDGDDIPLLINLVLMLYKNNHKIKIKKDLLKDVFLLLICDLLDRFKGDNQIDADIILMLLEPQIDLLFMSVNLPKCGCCSSRPPKDEEVNMMNKIKLSKLESKQRHQQLL